MGYKYEKSIKETISTKDIGDQIAELNEVYEKAKLFNEILEDCVMYGIGDTDTIKTTQDVLEEYMRKEGLL